jgi:hypothetical protein
MIDAPAETRKAYLARKKREQRAAAKAAGLCGICAKNPVSGKVTVVYSDSVFGDQFGLIAGSWQVDTGDPRTPKGARAYCTASRR